MEKWRRHQLVIAPSNNEPKSGDLILRHLWKGHEGLESKSLWRYFSTITIADTKQYTTLNSGGFRDHYINFQTHHLYVLSEETPQQGDWAFSFQDGILIQEIVKVEGDIIKDSIRIFGRKWYKIIASNNHDLKTTIDGNKGELLPDVSFDIEFPSINDHDVQWYVDQYQKGNEITEVMVKYASKLNTYDHWSQIIDVSSTNEIEFKPVTDTWSDIRRDFRINHAHRCSFEDYMQENYDVPNKLDHGKENV